MSEQVFISHSIKDKAVADAVCARLEASGVRCWIAPRDILPGLDWSEAIIDAISSSRLMVLIHSESANRSMQIKREVERAVSKGVTIVPMRIEDVAVSKSLEYYLSATYWFEAFPPPLEPHLDYLDEMVEHLLSNKARGADKRQTLDADALQGKDTQHHARHLPAHTEAKKSPLKSRRAKIIAGALFVLLACALALFFFGSSLKKLVYGEPESFEATLMRANNYAMRQEYEQALAEFDKAISLNPSSNPAHRFRGMTYAYRGTAWYVERDTDRAIEDFTQALKLDPNDDASYALRGWVYVTRNKFEPAMSDLNEAIRRNGRNPFSYFWRGNLHYLLKEYDAAISDYDAAIKLNSQIPDHYWNKANAQVEKGEYQLALENLNEAIRLNVSNAYLYKRRSYVYSKLGKADEARADDETAQRLTTSAQPQPNFTPTDKQ